MNRRGFIGAVIGVAAAGTAGLAEAQKRGGANQARPCADPARPLFPVLGERIVIHQHWTKTGPELQVIAFTVTGLHLNLEDGLITLGGVTDGRTHYTLDVKMGNWQRRPDGSFRWDVR